MTREILTDNGIYSYEEIELCLGRKIIDPEIAKKNLLDFKKVMDVHGVRYGLMYGTLLGAVREGGFIVYDEDADVFVLAEDRNKVLNALFDLEKLGLKVARHSDDERLLSVIRDDEYIDMYFFKKTFFKKRREGDSVVDANYLEHTETMEFLGEPFPVPGNPKQLLCVLYGEDWNIPKKNGKAMDNAFDRKIKVFLIEKLPFMYKIFNIFLGRK
ncbi:MAG: LicD family protein [Sulfurimonadaceae bacterium]